MNDFETKARTLHSRDVLSLRRWIDVRYPHAFSIFDYGVDYELGEIAFVQTGREEEVDDLTDSGDLIDTWANVVNGYCIWCREVPATCCFQHQVDGIVAGLCESCATYDF